MECPRILAVDDTPRDLDLLAQILEQQGYQLTLARDGAEALEMATRERPDLVLLDILMPGIDGIEVCRQLKAEPTTLDIPVIFLTSQSKPEDILIGFEAGAVDYVTKPFQIPELLARVHVHVKLRQAQQEIRTLRGFRPPVPIARRSATSRESGMTSNPTLRSTQTHSSPTGSARTASPPISRAT